MISEVPRVAPKPLPKVRIGALVALAAALAFTGWLLVHHFSAGTTPAVAPVTPRTTPAAATSSAAASTAATTSLAAVTAGQLTSTAAALAHPIYWAGEQSGMTYELKLLSDGSSSVRYLPAGIAVGDPRPYLQIATWKLPSAYAATVRAASKPGAVKLDAGPNAIAFYDSDRPIDVWEAFKGSSYQVEVFAPSAQQAQQIVTGGEIRDAAAGAAGVASSGPVAATTHDLATARKAVGHQLYWLGSRAGTYELTQTPNGRVYIRYLPAGAQVGTAVAYLTVGTYPLNRAYAVTKSAASQRNTTRIPLAHGVAFYNNKRPNSIYVAFRGVDEQIEIYDPSPTSAGAAADARQVVPVP